jgi:23S rRNA-/tRNA-specific pseudouridylate synthase
MLVNPGLETSRPARYQRGMECLVLYRDDELLAIHKPPGVAVHEAPGPGGSILRSLREQHGLAGLTPVHRLDKDVSGVLLLAQSKAAASAMQRLWPQVRKCYWALCEGIPAAPEGVVDAQILENQTGKPQRLAVALRYYREQHPGEKVPAPPPPKTSAVHPAGRPARTEYHLVEALGGRWSVLEVSPQQGRMHQVRVHLAHLGTPLAVDGLYGRRAVLKASDAGGAGEEVLLSRISLHAAQLVFPHFREPAREITVAAPLPADLEAVLERLRGSGT